MASLNVQIWDATGNKRQDVEVPDDAPVARIVAVLIDRMKFPQTGPDGQLLSYKLQHRASGRQLLEDQTLATAGAKAGDVLRLIPEITAGGGLRNAKCEMRIALHSFRNSQFAIRNR